MERETEIKKWGNGLGLRVNGAMAEIPNFEDGTKVLVTVTPDGLIVRKKEPSKKRNIPWPYTIEKLCQGLTPDNAGKDELPDLLDSEWGGGPND